MATFTAHVLIGAAPPNHDGILPSHALMVSENTRAALVLVPLSVHTGDAPSPDDGVPRRIVWIPHPDQVVDDLVLQVCVHVMRSPMVTVQTDEIVDGLSTADQF